MPTATKEQTQRRPGSPLCASFAPVLGGLLQRKCACGGTPGPTGECEECRKKRLQRKASQPSTFNPQPSEAPPIVHEVLRSPGQPLDPDARAFMEPRFGHDFSKVRVHSDAKAAESARAVNALAYTVGQHVVVGSQGVSSQTVAGRSLLAHELTHTIQQRSQNYSLPRELSVSSSSDSAESEAYAEAARIVGGIGHGASPLAPTYSLALQRLPFGITLPSGLRWLTPTEEAMATSVYGGSLNFSHILLTDAVGGGGRPFTLYVPSPIPFVSGATVINIGPSAYATPGSNRGLLIHELAHSWQSQHHPNPAQYMVSSLASQAAAAAVGGDAYCFVPGKWFGLYGAEQIANQVEKGVPAIVSHVSSVGADAPDLANIASLAVPHWEKSGEPGVVC